MESIRAEKERELIDQFLNGNEKAFNQLINKYHKGIYWHARRMVGNHLDADEITQEVIIVVYKKISGFKFNSSLKTWIYRITANKSKNLSRKRKIKNFLKMEDVETQNLKLQDDIILNYEDKEFLENLNAMLDEIPIKQKQVFVLRHFEGLSYNEISEITGKSVGGLKANYFNAAKKIFKMVEDEK
jgi:RNA polymerase sigma-70 factor (ECF subfamily)